MRLPERFEAWGEHATIGLPGARVVFTTRLGGFSSGPFESLNLGLLTEDSPTSVRRNRQRLEHEVGRPLAMIHQVHGTNLRRLDSAPDRTEELVKADGIVATTEGLAPMVLVADCLPVAVAGEGGLAMLHAGWRGLASGMLETGVAALRDAGISGPLQAAIGPCIGACCYEVGEEVHAAFETYGERVRRGGNLDLRGVARLQLERTGVEEIHELDLCTACHPELFFSHRRDRGVTGRQTGVAWLT